MPGMTSSGLSKWQKSPSQLVFVPSMAISQEDRMGIFVLNRLSHVSHLSDVGLTDFARAHRCHAGADSEHSCGCRRITNGGTSKRTRLTVARKRQSRLCSCRSGRGAPLVGLLITLVCSCRKPNITQPGEVNNAITPDMNSVNWKTPRAPTWGICVAPATTRD